MNSKTFKHIYERVHNGRQLLSTPFNNAFKNTLRTKLLDILFTKEGLTQGTVEPSKNTTPSCKQLNLLNEFWPSIVRSLKEKCLDSRRSSKKNNDSLQRNLQDEGIDVRRRRRIVYEPEESDEASITREEDSIEEDEARRPINLEFSLKIHISFTDLKKKNFISNNLISEKYRKNL
ncbi:hypothetical protein BpHYR1_013794, partial [Brachionus plicatilis]